jgi:hypothetical protein
MSRGLMEALDGIILQTREKKMKSFSFISKKECGSFSEFEIE